MDYEQTLRRVEEAIAEGTSLADGWQAIVDQIASEVEKTDTALIRSLDIKSDFRRIQSWLLRLFRKDPPPRGFGGMWFVLFHPNREGTTSCDLCLKGYREFDPDSHAWLTGEAYESTTTPKSTILARLYEISSKPQYESKRDVVHLGLWYAIFVIAELCRKHSAIIRGSASRRGVATGFASGDVVVVGVHSKLGFKAKSTRSRRKGKARTRLLPGKYFRLEGGSEAVLCDCANTTLPADCFRSGKLFSGLSLRATICREYPNQRGTFGSLAPFNIEIVHASMAESLFERFSGDIRIHNLEVLDRAEPWCVIQVMHCLECYDMEISYRQKCCTIVEDKIGEHDLFFVNGYYEWRAVFLSRRAAEAFIELGVSGAVFIPVATR